MRIVTNLAAQFVGYGLAVRSIKCWYSRMSDFSLVEGSSSFGAMPAATERRIRHTQTHLAMWGNLMDRSDIQHADEVWIAKYRAALQENIPVQPSGGIEFRIGLRNTCNIVFLLLRKVLGYFAVWNPPKSFTSCEPTPVQPKPVLQTDSSPGRKSPREASRNPSTRKSVGNAARSGLPRPTDKRPAERPA
jgi:hypothetical protein